MGNGKTMRVAKNDVYVIEVNDAGETIEGNGNKCGGYRR